MYLVPQEFDRARACLLAVEHGTRFFPQMTANLGQRNKGGRASFVPFSDVSHIHGMHMPFVLSLRGERHVRKKLGSRGRKVDARELGALRERYASRKADVEAMQGEIEKYHQDKERANALTETTEQRTEDTNDDVEELTEDLKALRKELEKLKLEKEKLSAKIRAEEIAIRRLVKERDGEDPDDWPDLQFRRVDHSAKVMLHTGKWKWSVDQGKCVWSCCLAEDPAAPGCSAAMERLGYSEMPQTRQMQQRQIELRLARTRRPRSAHACFGPAALAARASHVMNGFH